MYISTEHTSIQIYLSLLGEGGFVSYLKGAPNTLLQKLDYSSENVELIQPNPPFRLDTSIKLFLIDINTFILS